MKISLPFFAVAVLLALPVLAQTTPVYAPVNFTASSKSASFTATGLAVFSAGQLTIPGSVDWAGSPATLTGTTVIGGDLRIKAGSILTVAATGKLYVYGNTYIQSGGLVVQPGGHLYFYGNQFGIEPFAGGGSGVNVSGGGNLHFISPRPAPGQTADDQQRPASLDGLAGATTPQFVDGGSVEMGLSIEHRSATSLNLSDLNGDGTADLALSGTLALASDDAPLVLGNNNLFLDQNPAGATGTISGYSPTRYVHAGASGLVRVSGLPANTSFVFPVGHSATGGYTPVQLTNRAGTPTTLAVNVTATAPAPAPKPTAGTYWQVVTTDPTAIFDLTLEHSLSTNQSGYTDDAAAIVRYDGSKWVTVGSPHAGTSPGLLSTAGPVAGSSDLSQTLLTAPSSSNYYTKESANPLPVTLIAFEVKHAAGAPTVQLTWRTASELNNAGFEVQRSADGNAWAQIGYVPGNGTTTIAHSYSLTSAYAGAAYYRLHQVDTNGTSDYSPTRYVGPDGTTAAFSVYPNPSAGELTIVGADPNQPLVLLNMLGQVAATLPAGTTSTDLTGKLSSGVYLLRQGNSQARIIIK